MPITWNDLLITSEVQSKSVTLACQRWTVSLPLHTGSYSFGLNCRLQPFGQRLLVTTSCEHEKDASHCNIEVHCLDPEGTILWTHLVDSSGRGAAVTRLEKGVVIFASWDISYPKGLHNGQARLIDVDSGDILATYEVPVIEAAGGQNWEYSPSLSPGHFGVRMVATAYAPIPPEWGAALAADSRHP